MDPFLAILRPLNQVLAYATPVPQVVLNHQTGLAGGLSAYIPFVGIAGDGFTAASLLLSAGGHPSRVFPAVSRPTHPTVPTAPTATTQFSYCTPATPAPCTRRWWASWRTSPRRAGGLTGLVGRGDSSISSLFPHRLVNTALIGTAVAMAVGTAVAAVAGTDGAAASCWGEPAFLADLGSAFFYTVSRLPQVWLNHRECCCGWPVHPLLSTI